MSLFSYHSHSVRFNALLDVRFFRALDEVYRCLLSFAKLCIFEILVYGGLILYPMVSEQRVVEIRVLICDERHVIATL